MLGLDPSCMRVGPALRPGFSHVDPYELTHRKLYVSDTYTVFIYSNVHVYLPS
jgi:hypothetical protein